MAQIAIRKDHRSKYLDRMELGLEDKLWFIDNPILNNVGVFLDFGCADGILAEALLTLREDATVICFDEDDNFLRIAENRLLNFHGRYLICKTLQEAQEALFFFKSKKIQTATILSSVIHEVQTFSNAGEWEDFMDDLTNDSADFLIIRDMGVDQESTYTKVAQEDFEKLSGLADTSQLQDFEHKWGRVSFQDAFIHFLLKYHYTDNWEREMQEDYLVPIDPLVEDLEVRNFVVTYEEYYTHPWIKEQVLKDFDIQLVDPTHFKLILQKEEDDD